MIKFLKYINSIPFPFTMRHYQIFGETAEKMKDRALLSVESWEALRKEHPHFLVSQNREEWLLASEGKTTKDGQDKGFIKRAEEIVSLLKQKNIKKIFSVGVGGAGLEYQIKKMMPEIYLISSEYSEDNVSALKKVFIEADDIIKFDVLKGDWKEINEKYLGEDGLCLIYRLDAGFKDNEWKNIFKNLHSAGVKKVLFIPTGTLTIISIFNRKIREIKWFFAKIPVLWSGYLRTKKRFESYWKSTYSSQEMIFGGLKGFFLEMR